MINDVLYDVGFARVYIESSEVLEVRLRNGGFPDQTHNSLPIIYYPIPTYNRARTENCLRRNMKLDLSRLRLVALSVNLPAVTNTLNAQRLDATH